jgi:hypothetical protein
MLSLSLPFTCGSIREDEFLCNEAVEHLHDCCGENTVLPAHFCQVTSGCGGGHQPALTVEQSRCILGQSCSALQGMCAKLAIYGDAGPGGCL